MKHNSHNRSVKLLSMYLSDHGLASFFQVHQKPWRAATFNYIVHSLDILHLQLRDIRHENVNPLYGFLIDPLRPALVSEYCSRGSLWVSALSQDRKMTRLPCSY